jgi:hypothetical protein
MARAAGTAPPAPPVYGESDEGDFEIHMDRIGRELQCRICMAAYDDAVVTRCDHYFCNSCITSSIQHKKQCPLCKAPVTRRELRVDERMRAFVKTYRSVLASHGMKNAYCSQLPASLQSQEKSQATPAKNKSRRVSTCLEASAMPPPPPRSRDDSTPARGGRKGSRGGREKRGTASAGKKTREVSSERDDDDDDDEKVRRGVFARRARSTLGATSELGSEGKYYK